MTFELEMLVKEALERLMDEIGGNSTRTEFAVRIENGRVTVMESDSLCELW